MDASGYTAGGTASSGGGGATSEDTTEFWDVQKCKRAYQDYLGKKRDEIEEKNTARRYRHGAQWSADQIKALNRRKQPVVTFDHTGPKINGIVGALERLRQDAKAYPRTPQHQEGADLATAALRYGCDEQMWKAKSALCYEDGAVDGIGCMELELVAGDKTDGQPENGQPDYDIAYYPVRDGFFYDPRSFDLDFADAKYMGRGKWTDEETIKRLDPEGADIGYGSGAELSENTDRDNKWFYSTTDRKMIRLVDIWYLNKDDIWCWALFTGARIIKQGVSPWKNEKAKTTCKFIAFSAAVDHDGDRYGLIRILKGPQDEVNQRHSKALHQLNSRRIKATKNAVATGDIEAVRREAAKPDGVVLYNPGQDSVLEFDDAEKQANIMGQFEMLQYATAAIENYGPDSKAIGNDGAKAESGRALAIRQQAGFSQLGPFFGSVKSFNLRFYRALFCGMQQHWTGERWVRVTDNQGLPQFIQINGVQIDPMTGQPTMVNAIGSLDVDIIVDEGPDTVTMQQDTFEALSQALPAVAGLISPNVAAAALEVLVENSTMPEEAKKKFREAGKQPAPPDPEMMKAQIEQQRDQAKFQLEAQKAAADMQNKREVAALEAQIAREQAENEMKIEVFKAQSKIQLEREIASSKMQIERERSQTEQQIAREQADHGMEVSAEVAAQKMDIAKQQARARPAAK